MGLGFTAVRLQGLGLWDLVFGFVDLGFTAAESYLRAWGLGTIPWNRLPSPALRVRKVSTPPSKIIICSIEDPFS